MAAFSDNAARAAQSAANSVAVDARNRVKRVIPEVFDQPEDLTRNSIIARQKRLSSVRATKDVSADIAIKDLPQRWMSWHLGDEEQVRKPADIGMGKKHIMIPVVENLTSAEAKAAGVSVTVTPGGNLPPGTLQKLFGMTGPGGKLWWGRVRKGGAEGLWLRPARIGRRNLHAPKLLIAAKDRATYRPSLQGPMDAALRKAARLFPAKLRKAMRQQRWRR